MCRPSLVRYSSNGALGGVARVEQAAVVLQRRYRKHLRDRWWREHMARSRAVTVIQVHA